MSPNDATSRLDRLAHCAFRRRATTRRLILAPLTTQFVEQHPGVRVHLSVVPDNLISAEGGFDIIVSSQKPSLPGVVAHDLGAIRHVICGSPQYFRKFGRPKTPQDLREHNCLADLYSGPKSWPFQNSPRPLLVEVKGSLSSNSNAVLIRMALNGSGIIRVPLHTVQEEIAAKRLDVIIQNRFALAGANVRILRKNETPACKNVRFHQFPEDLTQGSGQRLNFSGPVKSL